MARERGSSEAERGWNGMRWNGEWKRRISVRRGGGEEGGGEGIGGSGEMEKEIEFGMEREGREGRRREEWGIERRGVEGGEWTGENRRRLEGEIEERDSGINREERGERDSEEELTGEML